MHKSNQNNALRERNGLRLLVAISLTTFLAGLGACTTNYTPGNGQPTPSGSYGTMPRAGTYGSSSGTQGSVPQSRMIVAPDVITPMFSSSSEAAAVLAGHQGRFLGYANPGPASPNYGNDIITGQVIPPALIVNPQSTVNSSISSPPTPVITSGVGGGDVSGGVVFGGLSAPATATGTTAAITAPLTTTATGTTATTAATSPLVSAAPIFATPSTLITPANAAIQTTSGAFAAGPGVTATTTTNSTNQNTGLLTPTVSSSLTPSPTAASNPPVGNVGTRTAATSNLVTTPAATTTGTITRSATANVVAPQRIPFPSTVSQSSSSALTSSSTVSGRVARPVRMTTSSSGSVVITNQ